MLFVTALFLLIAAPAASAEEAIPFSPLIGQENLPEAGCILVAEEGLQERMNEGLSTTNRCGLNAPVIMPCVRLYGGYNANGTTYLIWVYITRTPEFYCDGEWDREYSIADSGGWGFNKDLFPEEIWIQLMELNEQIDRLI